MIKTITKELEKAEKPILIFGHGIKLAGCKKEALELLRTLNIPVALTWGTLDMLPYNDRLNAGMFGTIGTKYANMAVQNADFILSLGSRLDSHNIGTNIKGFAPNATKIAIDIDKEELNKLKPYVEGCVMDLRQFFKEISSEIIITKDCTAWINRINKWKKLYPVCKKKYHRQRNFVNPYSFLEKLSEVCDDNEIIIPDAGQNVSISFQGFKVRSNQTIFSAYNNSPMGYALPASIGASIANNKRQVVCIIGDGGLQMNIQELATIHHHKLPIKIFIFNNSGYGMMKQTQDDWLKSQYEAADIEHNVPLPDIMEVARAYGFPTEYILNNKDLSRIKDILSKPYPMIIDVRLSPEQRIKPKLLFGKNLEDI